MSNPRPPGDLRDWLTARLEDQLDERAPQPAPKVPPGARSGTAPVHGLGGGRPLPQARAPGRGLHEPVHVGLFDEEAPTMLDRRGTTDHDEEDDTADPVTVQGHEVSLEDSDDPRTVRINRMPVSFIGESVIDPATVRVDSEEAERWRQQAPLDEIQHLPRGTPTPWARAPLRAPAEEAPARAPAGVGRQDWVGLFATAVLGGGIGLVLVGIWAWMIR